MADAVERAGPNDGDASGNGVPDAGEPDVASLPNAVDGAYVMVTVPPGTWLSDVAAAPVPAGTPARLQLPYGLVAFTVGGVATGGRVTARLYVPLDASIQGVWKHGPSATDPTTHWHEVEAELDPSFPGFSALVARFDLVDGGDGDADLVADGRIVDPVAVGTWTNGAPVAVDDVATTSEDAPITLDLVANDHDPDGETLVVTGLDTGSTTGAANVNPDGTVTWDPSGRFETLRPGDTVTDSFGYTVADGHGGTDTGLVRISVTGTEDALAVSVDATSVLAQHGDGIAPVIVTATDVDSPSLTIAATGLPAGLAIGPTACVPDGSGSTCTAQVSGTVAAKAGVYPTKVTATDGTLSTAIDLTVNVAAEDATLALPAANPAFVKVRATTGKSGSISLKVVATETVPDTAAGDALPGDIGTAGLSIRLVPVSGGSAIAPSGRCTRTPSGSGYGRSLVVTCPFAQLSPKAYAVQATADGVRFAGATTGALAVADPRTGSASGGGAFTWPGKGGITRIAFTARARSSGATPKGSTLLIRWAPGGQHVVRASTLSQLRIGRDGTTTWAKLSGHASYQAPGWTAPKSGYTITLYVRDRTATDRIWVELRDPAGARVAAMSMATSAAKHTVPLTRGGIIVRRF